MNINRLSFIPAFLALIVILVEIGCNGTTGVIRPEDRLSYAVHGAVIKDTNRDGAMVAVEIQRNDTLLPSAVVRFGDDTLLFNDPGFRFFTGIDSVYANTDIPVDVLPEGTYTLEINDTAGIADSLMQFVADTFAVTEISPFNRLVQANEQVQVQWSTVPGIDGFVLAAVKADETYIGSGYAAVVNTGVNQGTIPPDAFLSADSLTPDTGLYNIYVYAYKGTPDSMLARRLLPTPFPVQLPDNVDRTQVDGHFGSVVVSLLDTIRVVLGAN